MLIRILTFRELSAKKINCPGLDPIKTDVINDIHVGLGDLLSIMLLSNTVAIIPIPASRVESLDIVTLNK